MIAPALVLIAAIASADVADAVDPPDAVVASLVYEGPDGTRSEAFTLSAGGTAVVRHRGQRLSAELPSSIVTRLRRRLSGERLAAVSQQAFDEAVRGGAAVYGLALPIPAADGCVLTLPGGSVRCVGSAILAERMPAVDAVNEFERLRAEFEQFAGVVILGGVSQLHAFLRAAESQSGQTVRLSDMTYCDRFEGERVAHFQTDAGLIVVTAGDGPPSARLVDPAGL